MQDKQYIVVAATTLEELEKKVNDRMNFGYAITPASIVILGANYVQTMVKTK